MPRPARGRRLAVPALTCVAALLLASCSGGDDERFRHNDLGRCAATPSAPPTPAPSVRPAARRAPNLDDFDGDGHHDLLLNGWYKRRGESWAPNRALLLGSSAGIAAGRRISLTDRFPGIDGKMIGNPEFQGGGVSALTGDLDGDGRADILFDRTLTDKDGRVIGYDETFLWGGEGGVAGSPHRRPEAPAPHIAVGDFDGDGALDLVSGAYRANRDERNRVRCVALEFGPFGRDGSPRETRRVDITRGGRVSTASFTTGDFDGDGRDEFVTTGYREGRTRPDEDVPETFTVASYYRVGGDRSTVLAGGVKALGDGARFTYREGEEEPPLTALDHPVALRTADFGGNGRTDLLTEDKVVYGGPAGPGTGRAPTPLPEDHDNLATGDVNGDGRDDLVTGDYRSLVFQVGLVSVFLGGPHGLAKEPAYTLDREAVGMPGSPAHGYERDYFGTDLALADLNGDGADELAVATQDFGTAPREGTYWIVPGGRRGPVPGEAVRMDVEGIGRE